MRLAVEAAPGSLARDPGGAVVALRAAAVADGADAGWTDEAVKALGGSRVAVPVDAEPRYEVVREATAAAVDIYRRAMDLALAEIAEILAEVHDPDGV